MSYIIIQFNHIIDTLDIPGARSRNALACSVGFLEPVFRCR